MQTFWRLPWKKMKRNIFKRGIKMMRLYTWKPDMPDFRDHLFHKHPMFVRGAELPASVDLRPKMPPVFDQGELGSCTGNAIAGALSYLEYRDNDATFDISRLFIYYQERVIEDTVAWDEGAEIRDGIKACANVGYCAETLWPYDPTQFAVKPPDTAYADATAHKISEYMRAVELIDYQTALAAGLPVAFGFTVYDSFQSDEVAQTGVVPMPAKSESSLGGHAVLMVGYDDASQRVIVRNSWGSAWGQGGYFTLPYAYVTDRTLSDDFWVITK
jgi:C1A family cysteine protease